MAEKAEAAFEAEEAEEAAARLLEGTFTLDDFLEQMQQVKKMGPLGNLMGMMPGLPKEARDVEIDDRQIARIEGIIHSMTPAVSKHHGPRQPHLRHVHQLHLSSRQSHSPSRKLQC